jgi:hypothetical protein
VWSKLVHRKLLAETQAESEVREERQDHPVASGAASGRVHSAVDRGAGHGGEIQARDANALFLGLAGLARVIEGSELAAQVEELRRVTGLDVKGKR